MKNIILFLICLVVNITASSQVRVVFDGTPYGWTGRDSVIIKKQIDKIKKKWKNSNSLVGEDSIRIIISNADVAVVSMYFLSDYQMIEGRSIVKLLKKEKCPFFSVTLFYNGAFLGTCKYDPIKKEVSYSLFINNTRCRSTHGLLRNKRTKRFIVFEKHFCNNYWL